MARRSARGAAHELICLSDAGSDLSGRSRQQFPRALGKLRGLGMEENDKQAFVEKLHEIEEQARLVLDDMVATPSIHRTRLLHIIALTQQLQALLAS